MQRRTIVNHRLWHVTYIITILLIVVIGFWVSANQASSVSALTESSPAQIQADTPWHIFFDAIPTSDGTGLVVFTEATTEVSGSVEAEVTVGGAARCYGMTYGSGSYQTTATEILIAGVANTGGTIGLAANLDGGDVLETDMLAFNRYLIPTTNAPLVQSDDGLLSLAVADNSLPASAYILVMTTNTLPGPAANGQTPVGDAYTIRASGANPTSAKPMLLTLTVPDAKLGQTDPQELLLMQWNAGTEQWQSLDSSITPVSGGYQLNAPVSRFTVYTVMSEPRWHVYLPTIINN